MAPPPAKVPPQAPTPEVPGRSPLDVSPATSTPPSAATATARAMTSPAPPRKLPHARPLPSWVSTATKASSSLWVRPLNVVSKAPGETGKSLLPVKPATTARSLPSTATLQASSRPTPARKVDHTSASPPALSRVAKPSLKMKFTWPSSSKAPGVVGKSPAADVVLPTRISSPPAPSATSWRMSTWLPPNRVHHTRWPAASKRAAKASSLPCAPTWNAPAVVGKSDEKAQPPT